LFIWVDGFEGEENDEFESEMCVIFLRDLKVIMSEFRSVICESSRMI